MEQEFPHLVTVMEEQEVLQLFQQLVLPEAAEVVDKVKLELMADQVVEVLGKIQVPVQQEDQEIPLQQVQLKECLEVLDIVQVLHMQQPVVAVQLKQV